MLASKRENPFKVKAYRRAARTIRAIGDSFSDLVHSGADLTVYPGIGTAISGVIQEIVRTGSARQLESLREANPELADLTAYPLLDTRRVRRIYKKLGISSVTELKEKLESGDVATEFGSRMEQHVRRALVQPHEILWYEAQSVVAELRKFLLPHGVRRAEPAGDYRRRVEVLSEIAFLIEAEDFPAVVGALERYGGRADLLQQSGNEALLKL